MNGSLQATLKQLGKTKGFLEDATLDLSKQGLTVEDVPDIISWLEDKTPSSLSTLNLAGNALSSQEPLHTFSLAANDYKTDNLSASPGSPYGSFGVLPSVSFHPLEKLFLQFKGWKSVNLSQNGLASMEMASLVGALETHSGLTSLVLDDNVLGKQGVGKLTGLLKKSSSLKYLSLVSCQLTTQQVKLLAEALQENQSLRELDVSQNAVDQNAVGEAFNRLLHKNQHLTKIIFDDSGLLLPLGEYIKGKLTSNQQKQQALQNDLLSPPELFKEAKRAIECDERDWLRVLLGSSFEGEDQRARFVAQQEAYLTQKCLLEFQGNLISEQLY